VSPSRAKPTSDAERDLVTHLAESVRGVKVVSNNMTVKG
jgi:osmotically-inducible protein OsmY